MDSTIPINLLPRFADAEIFEGEGGAYHSWSPSEFPILGEANVGAGKLVLRRRGFALPHYADSNKICYVLQGRCTVGLVSHSAATENVVLIEKGDAIPVPMGAVSWWFNGGNTDVIIVFLGETSRAYTSGQFTYFLLTGALGLLSGFSADFLSKTYGITESESETLAKSQPNPLLIEVDEEIEMPSPIEDDFRKRRIEIDGAEATFVTEENFPALKEVGLSANLVKLSGGEVRGPTYAADSSVQVIYVVRGGGRIQIVGLNGRQVLDGEAKAGQLVVVPRFFAAALIAGGEGMEYLSVITSSKPVLAELTGNKSVWKAISSPVLQASLGVTPKFEQFFKSKLK